jgi:hypothetical protein
VTARHARATTDRKGRAGKSLAMQGIASAPMRRGTAMRTARPDPVALQAARDAVIAARRAHAARLGKAADGLPTDLMHTRRAVMDAERRFREIAGRSFNDRRA